MISDGMLIVQSGSGTLQFPIEQVERILALPDSPVNTVPNNSVLNEGLLEWAAIQEGLEPDFLRSVAVVESGLHQEALSPKGAVGLLQLMPFVADKMGVDPKVAEQNALGGAAVLRRLLIRYNGDTALALAAYNAGPSAVDKYKGVPPYRETRRYVNKVLEEYARRQRLQAQKNSQEVKASKPSNDASTVAAANLPAQQSNVSSSAASVTQ